MTPSAFAKRVTRLFHVTDRPAWAFIEAHGLLSTDSLVETFVDDSDLALELRSRKRFAPVLLHEDERGRVLLNDNLPLIFPRLAGALDDGLTPDDWLRILNERVYFFPTLERAASFIEAGRRGGREKLLLTFDALSIASAHLDDLFIAPINTGSALRSPARRGRSTFAPAARVSWEEFAARRRATKRTPDTVAEISLLGGLPDVSRHLVEEPRPI